MQYAQIRTVVMQTLQVAVDVTAGAPKRLEGDAVCQCQQKADGTFCMKGKSFSAARDLQVDVVH